MGTLTLMLFIAYTYAVYYLGLRSIWHLFLSYAIFLSLFLIYSDVMIATCFALGFGVVIYSKSLLEKPGTPYKVTLSITFDMLVFVMIILLDGNFLVGFECSEFAKGLKTVVMQQLLLIDNQLELNDILACFFAVLLLWKAASKTIQTAMQVVTRDELDEECGFADDEMTIQQCSCGNGSIAVKYVGKTVTFDWVTEGNDAPKSVSNRTSSGINGSGGEWIGFCERTIIFILVMVGQYAAIAFVVAAKAIARYDKITKEPKFGDKFLIGSFISIIISLIIGLWCKKVMGL